MTKSHEGVAEPKTIIVRLRLHRAEASGEALAIGRLSRDDRD